MPNDDNKSGGPWGKQVCFFFVFCCFLILTELSVKFGYLAISVPILSICVYFS